MTARRLALILVAMVALSAVPLPDASAASGDLDPNFSDDGWGLLGIGNSASAVAIQPDGRIVVAGVSRNAARFLLARYLPDGTLDPSFDADGVVKTDFPESQVFESALALLPDGRIVAAGWIVASSHGHIAVARYRPDGTLDPTFSRDGRRIINGRWDSFSDDMALQPDGKIVVVGAWRAPDETDAGGALVVRLDTDGTLDSTFGRRGKRKVAFPMLGATSVAIQADGGIVIVGNNRAFPVDWALARLNPDGALDPSFGTDGIVTDVWEGGPAFAENLVLQPDGKILGAGEVLVGGRARFAMARFEEDGTLDPTFSGNGLKRHVFLDGEPLYLTSVTLQGRRIFVAGGFPYRVGGLFLARLHQGGKLDEAFGADGAVVPSDPHLNGASDVAVQGDGKIVTVGSGWDVVRDDQSAAVARFLGS